MLGLQPGPRAAGTMITPQFGVSRPNYCPNGATHSWDSYGDEWRCSFCPAVFRASPPSDAAQPTDCVDCGRHYGSEYGFPDLVLPNEVWAAISPRGDGGGMLCPSCICKRLADRGFEDVLAVFRSGPCCVLTHEEKIEKLLASVVHAARTAGPFSTSRSPFERGLQNAKRKLWDALNAHPKDAPSLIPDETKRTDDV